MYSQYIYSLILYTVNNKHLHNINIEIHKYRTRYSNNLHRPIVSSSKFNKGVHFSGINVSNHLPEYINNLSNDWKCFTSNLEVFILSPRVRPTRPDRRTTRWLSEDWYITSPPIV